MAYFSKQLAAFSILVATLASSPSQALVKEKENFVPFSKTQYYLIPALLAGSIVLNLTEPPATARWSGGILFDGPARDLLRLDTRGARDTAASVGDVLLFSLITYPGLVDAGLDAGVGNHDSRMAGELFLANTQAFLVSAVAVLALKRLTGRKRPFQDECAADASADPGCNSSDSRSSFFSGHSAFAFTGAGLICAHHKGLELWGGMTPCYIAVGAAVITALTRIMADRHYATDVVTGALVGWISGFVLTRSYQYRPKAGASGGSSAMLMPSVHSQGLGLSISFGL
jgi:membrane-associated phospholipid phosphatase